MPKTISLDSKKTLTPAHEDYIKTIYLLHAKGCEVNNSALAQQLNVTPASATNMVKKLAELGLVEYEPYQRIWLTKTGERAALAVLRHHRLLELYLYQKLKLPWEQVHAEAEKLEHVISEVLEDALATALNNPTVDPHGDPIPSKEGVIKKVEGILLSTAELNRPYRLIQVLVQDQERLSYLGTLGLYPNTRVILLTRAPFAGPLLTDVAGTHHALAHGMAELLVVTPLS